MGFIKETMRRTLAPTLPEMNPTTDHLTTGTSSSPVDLLKDVHFKVSVLIMVSVKPRHQLTGMLAEQNAWINNVWNEVLEAFPQVIGCRVLWNTLLFVLDAQKYIEPESVFEKILADTYAEDMKSICVSRITEGDFNHILKGFDVMQQETSSELDFGKVANIRVRIVDGQRVT